MMISMKRLQEKVNKIAKDLGGLDTNEKLEQARRIAREGEEINDLLLEILDEALTRRWNKDMQASIERFLAVAR